MSEPPEIEFSVRPGCLLIHVRGREIVQNKPAVIKMIGDAIRKHQVRAALLDTREVPGPVSFMDRFQLGTLAGQHLSGLRIGVLARPDQADPQRIGQLVAKNRGVEVEVFTDPAAADAWLKERAQA